MIFPERLLKIESPSEVSFTPCLLAKPFFSVLSTFFFLQCQPCLVPISRNEDTLHGSLNDFCSSGSSKQYFFPGSAHGGIREIKSPDIP